MGMLTGGLLAVGKALERVLAAWTRTPLHGLVTGVALTALVQSSTAMTVVAIGFVNAGLLGFTLGAMGGVRLQPGLVRRLAGRVAGVLAQGRILRPALHRLGMALHSRAAPRGAARWGRPWRASACCSWASSCCARASRPGPADAAAAGGRPAAGRLLGVLIGLLMTVVLQASSATLAIVLTAVAGGTLPVETGAAIVIGANVGTTLTGILAALRATLNARRLAAAHVLFNVVAAVVAFALLAPMLVHPRRGRGPWARATR